MRRLAAFGIVVAMSLVLVADEMSAQADPRANFPGFRTFALRTAEINSDRPELDNPLFAKKLGPRSAWRRRRGASTKRPTAQTSLLTTSSPAR